MRWLGMLVAGVCVLWWCGRGCGRCRCGECVCVAGVVVCVVVVGGGVVVGVGVDVDVFHLDRLWPMGFVGQSYTPIPPKNIGI